VRQTALRKVRSAARVNDIRFQVTNLGKFLSWLYTSQLSRGIVVKPIKRQLP